MFADVLEDVAAALRAVGIGASVDPRNLTPPAVLVRGDTLAPGQGKLCGRISVRYSLLLLAPDVGETGAYAQLEVLYGRVAALDGAGVVALTGDDRPFERTVLPDSPTALPTLRLTGAAVTTTAILTPFQSQEA
jgi:hypothetical protein